VLAVDALRQLLGEDMEFVARELLSDIKADRRGELRGRGRDGALWVVQLRGRKAGICLNAADNSGANPFDFVRRAGNCGSLPEACRLAESLLGLADSSPAQQRELQRHAAARAIEAQEQAARDAEQRAADVAARRLEYLAGARLDDPDGSAAALYLTARRCLPLAPAGAAIRSAIHLSREGHRTGATMLAPITRPEDGSVVAWHETALQRRGPGNWGKADGTAKRVWGPAKGGWIELAPGDGAGATGHGADATGHGADATGHGADTLLLSEGIENGLTAHALLPELPAAAAYSVGNLVHLALPERFRRVVLVRDRESNPRSHGPAARAAAIARWWAEGRAVTVLDPPAGFEDWNDAARKRGLQRNPAAPDPAKLLAQAVPIGQVERVAAYCALFGAPACALAHPGVAAGAGRYPALLLRAIGMDGRVQGIAGLLLDDSGDATAASGGARLLHPYVWAGERAGTVLPLRVPFDGVARLAVGIEAALREGAELAVLDLAHLAECWLPRAIDRPVLLAGDMPEKADQSLLWREGLRRLHVGRELTIAPAREAVHA
jgi:hypothetical protein